MKSAHKRLSAITKLLLSIIIISGLFLTGCPNQSDEENTDNGTKTTETKVSPCYFDLASEPDLVTTSAGTVQRCSTYWEEATDKTCLSNEECESKGGICNKRDGSELYDLECLTPCQPEVCPNDLLCKVCDDAEPFCDTTRSCEDPVYEQFDGHDNSCTLSEEPKPCNDYRQCCSNKDGSARVCTQPFYSTDLRPIRDAQCNSVCEYDQDCGQRKTWCCRALDSSGVPYPVFMLTTTEAPTGGKQPSGGVYGTTYSTSLNGESVKVCYLREYHDDCPAINTNSGGSSGGNSGSSGGSSDPCSRCLNNCGYGQDCNCEAYCL